MTAADPFSAELESYANEQVASEEGVWLRESSRKLTSAIGSLYSAARTPQGKRYQPQSRRSADIELNIAPRLERNDAHRLTTFGRLKRGNYWRLDPRIPSSLWRQLEFTRMSPAGEILQQILVGVVDTFYSAGLDVAVAANGDYIVADALGIANDKGRLLRVKPNGNVSTIVTTPLWGAQPE